MERIKKQHSAFTIEAMQEADIVNVNSLEQAAYRSTRPKRDYLYELRYNRLAHYFVMHPTAAHTATVMIGAAGIWMIGSEAHVITIAIHPTWQQHSLGAWLLLRLLEEGRILKAETATLEVRPSNQRAITLYQKYGFEEVGRRPNYYSDTGEDALILTTPALSSATYQARLTQSRNELAEQLAQINVDKIL